MMVRTTSSLCLHLFSVVVEAGGSGCSVLNLAIVSRDVPGEGPGIALTRLEERRRGLVASTEACQVYVLLAFFIERVYDCRDGDLAGGRVVGDGYCEGDLVARWLLDLLEVDSLDAKWRTECRRW